MLLPTRQQHNRGLTLVEITVALGVMTFVVLMFAATLPMAARTSKMNGNYAQAISLCQHKIDQMRAVGYGRLTYTELRAAEIIDSTPTSPPYSFYTVDELGNYFASATGTIDLQTFDTNITRVTVRLNWTGCGTRQTAGSYSLVALIAKE